MLFRSHSIYVDQWDWEKVITKEQRKIEYLKETVKTIYAALKALERKVNFLYPEMEIDLPENIYFITTQELEDMYPDSDPEERENIIAKEQKAVFLMKIRGSCRRAGNRTRRPRSGRRGDRASPGPPSKIGRASVGKECRSRWSPYH